MSSVSVDHARASTKLVDAWNKTTDQSVTVPAPVKAWLDEVLIARDVTYKYILVTGLLGKCTNPEVHPRALQTESSLQYAYDARSLCHKVVVPFEKSKGDLFGLSNEPLVNKPARHREHDKTNTQLKNKKLAGHLHDALEFANTAPAEDVFAMLVHVLRRGKHRAESRAVAEVEMDTTYRRVIDFVAKFMQKTDGGSHLVAIVGAFAKLLNDGFTVTVYPTTVSDKYARTAGDIEIKEGDEVIVAYECKQRPVNLEDIQHGLKKAKEMHVSEYSFIYSAGLAPGQEAAIRAEVQAEENLDVLLFDIHDIYGDWAAALNPVRRKLFGETVVDLLRESMRRNDVAEEATALWNSLK